MLIEGMLIEGFDCISSAQLYRSISESSEGGGLAVQIRSTVDSRNSICVMFIMV